MKSLTLNLLLLCALFVCGGVFAQDAVQASDNDNAQLESTYATMTPEELAEAIVKAKANEDDETLAEIEKILATLDQDTIEAVNAILAKIGANVEVKEKKIVLRSINFGFNRLDADTVLRRGVLAEELSTGSAIEAEIADLPTYSSDAKR